MPKTAKKILIVEGKSYVSEKLGDIIRLTNADDVVVIDNENIQMDLTFSDHHLADRLHADTKHDVKDDTSGIRAATIRAEMLKKYPDTTLNFVYLRDAITKPKPAISNIGEFCYALCYGSLGNKINIVSVSSKKFTQDIISVFNNYSNKVATKSYVDWDILNIVKAVKAGFKRKKDTRPVSVQQIDHAFEDNLRKLKQAKKYYVDQNCKGAQALEKQFNALSKLHEKFLNDAAAIKELGPQTPKRKKLAKKK